MRLYILYYLHFLYYVHYIYHIKIIYILMGFIPVECACVSYCVVMLPYVTSVRLAKAPRLRAAASLQPLALSAKPRLLALPMSWTKRQGALLGSAWHTAAIHRLQAAGRATVWLLHSLTKQRLSPDMSREILKSLVGKLKLMN